MFKFRIGLVLSICLVTCAPSAHAQWAVIDVGAITQLIQQVITMQEQLTTAKNQLTQAKQSFEAMTGDRGMSGLLSGEKRNYLPTDWSEVENALRGVAGGYGAISSTMSAILEANAVLSQAELDALPPEERARVQASRNSAALYQAVAREALASSSERFASIQQLIQAISGARDQKAILDLQARISAEQGMLQNEQTKLQSLYQAAQAEERAEEQRVRERGIADIGSFRNLPRLPL